MIKNFHQFVNEEASLKNMLSKIIPIFKNIIQLYKIKKIYYTEKFDEVRFFADIDSDNFNEVEEDFEKDVTKLSQELIDSDYTYSLDTLNNIKVLNSSWKEYKI